MKEVILANDRVHTPQMAWQTLTPKHAPCSGTAAGGCGSHQDAAHSQSGVIMTGASRTSSWPSLSG